MDVYSRDTIAWLEQSLPIWSKNAVLITSFHFIPPYLEEMAKSYTLKLTEYVDNEQLRSLFSPEEEYWSLLNGETKEVECYLFNHRYADGSFFKMRLKYDPDVVSTSSSQQGGYYFVGPWQEVIDSGAIKAASHVKVYGYREEGKVVFVFIRRDLSNFMQEVLTVDGQKVGKWAVFRVTWTNSLRTQRPSVRERVDMTF